MGDESGLPGLSQTVDLGGGPKIEGNPLEFIRQKARENIALVNKNKITSEEEKLAFKREVLKRLQVVITEFEEIDKKYAAQKAAEPSTESGEESAEGGEKAAEEDPFADIFGPDVPVDESAEEKMPIAQKFVSNLKMYKVEFLKQVRVQREQSAKQQDAKKMEEILAQLNTPDSTEPKKE